MLPVILGCGKRGVTAAADPILALAPSLYMSASSIHYRDTARTQVATAGDTLGSLTNSADPTNNWQQGTPSKRPALVANSLGSLPGFEFDGVDDISSLTSEYSFAAYEWMWSLVIRTGIATDTVPIAGSSDYCYLHYDLISGGVSSYLLLLSGGTATPLPERDIWFTLDARRSGIMQATTFSLNGTDFSTNGTGTGNIKFLDIGGWAVGGGYNAKIKTRRFVAWSAPLSAGDRAIARAAMNEGIY